MGTRARNEPHMDVRDRLTCILAEVNRQVVVGRTHPRNLPKQPEETQPEANSPQEVQPEMNSSPEKHLPVSLRDDHVRPRYGLTVLDNQVRPGRLTNDGVAVNHSTREAEQTICSLPLDVSKKGSDLCSNHGAFPFLAPNATFASGSFIIISY